MILRSLLLLIFLFQAGFSPMLGGGNFIQKQKIEKSESKSKPVKSDVLEEDEDESESEKHHSFSPSNQRLSFEFKSNTLYRKESLSSLNISYSFNPVSIIIWIQDFRI
jgi:hypothetical protein